MKVKELISELNKLHPNLELYIASDPEGNCFIRLTEANLEIGWIQDLDYTIEGYNKIEDDLSEDDIPILVIYPG